MACCNGDVQQFNSALLTSLACASMCLQHPDKCGAWNWNDSTCTYCFPDEVGLDTCANPYTLRDKQCFSNKCMACPDVTLTARHNMTIYLSSECGRRKDPAGSAARVRFPDLVRDIKIIGTGTIITDLPATFGKNVSIKGDVTFRPNCTKKPYVIPRAAILLPEGGDVQITGRVAMQHAESFVASSGPSIGGTVEFDPSSTITYTGVDAICVLALAHAAGDITVDCGTQFYAQDNTTNGPDVGYVLTQSLQGGKVMKTNGTAVGYVVTQSLQGGKGMILPPQNGSECPALNLSDLLNVYGVEYEVRFFNFNPLETHPAVAAFHVITFVTVVVGIVTLVANQNEFLRIITEYIA